MGVVDIKFIAQKAGVSIATVSRVLNNTKKVSEPVRARVMEAVEKYNYRPNTLARGLITNQSNLIGIVMPNVSDMFHARLLSSIEHTADQYDYNVIVSNIYSDFEKEKKSFEVFRERRVDGIILLHENTQQEMKALEALVEVPIVLASVNVEDSTLPCVGIDDARAAFDAASYLIRIGHERIAGIFGQGYSLDTLRKTGFCQAMDAAGLPVREEWVVHCECTIRDGIEATKQLMGQSELPTAIFCVSDEIAIGVMDHLAKLGYDVPADISVFGLDDIDMAHIIRPRLSTVNQPVDEIGTQAMRLLAALIRSSEVNTRLVLPHSLVLRDSCRNIAPRKV